MKYKLRKVIILAFLSMLLGLIGIVFSLISTNDFFKLNTYYKLFCLALIGNGMFIILKNRGDIYDF
jgi:hypothetical protein